MSRPATEAPRRHRLRVEQYLRMAEVGILRPDSRVELIDGEILDMAPIGNRHAGVVDQLTRILQRAVGDQGHVRVQGPISLDAWSQPQPDVAVLRPRADFYKPVSAGPGDVLLLIEVAESTLRHDRDVKIPLYARHKVPEVWLVDLENGQLTRYRRPGESGYGLVDQPDLEAALPVGTSAPVEVDLSGLWDS